MRIVLEDYDIKRLAELNVLISETDDYPLYIKNTGDKYYIEFTCVDVAKANLFVAMMMSPDLDTISMIRSTCGIDINCISYRDTNPKKEELKKMLQDFIDKL